MENPFEKKPTILIISLGAIVLLILGAGIISTYFNNKTNVPQILPDSPYSIAWEEASANLVLNGEANRPIRAKFSLLNAQNVSSTTEGTTTRALVFTIDAFILDLSSSTSKICAWKFPINLRRVADELGTLAAPKEAYFESTKDTERCIRPGFPTLVEKNIVFPIPETERGFLFSTDNSSNVLFSVQLNEDGTIGIDRTPQDIPG